MIKPWVVGQLAALAHALPNPKEENWRRVILLADWLVGYSKADFTANQVALELLGNNEAGNARSIGRMLAYLPGKPQAKNTSRIVNGRPVSCYLWDTVTIQTILHDHAVLMNDGEGHLKRNASLTGLYAADSALLTTPPLKINTLIPSSLLRCYGDRELKVLESVWYHQHSRPYSFKTSLKVAQAILNNSIWDDTLRQDDQYSCLRFTAGTKDNGYVSVNNWWLQQIFSEGTITINDLPTATASRLIAMVEFPIDVKDWKSSDGPSKHVHHLCNVRDCVLPKHLMIANAGLHKQFHAMSGDTDHPCVI